MRYYRTIVLISTVAWFMIGLHVPALHNVTDHGSALSPSLVVALMILVVVGAATLFALLRDPIRATRQ